MTRPSRFPPPPLTVEECVAVGGHCWQPAQFETVEAVDAERIEIVEMERLR